MKTLVALGIGLALVVGCKKDKKVEEAQPKPAATLTTGTVNTDGVRTVAIQASEKGYVPERIPGKPGEKLKLVFTRTVEGECLSQLKTPDGKLVDLPMNKPVEVDVTVPAEGQIEFACGMDMVHGLVVAEKG
jgi:plastocyanin domain-containing protein